MKVRVRISNGKPVVSLPVEEGTTIYNLKEALTAHSHGLCSHLFELSLNGKDGLEESLTLKELGIVSGDLLRVLNKRGQSSRDGSLANQMQDPNHVTIPPNEHAHKDITSTNNQGSKFNSAANEMYKYSHVTSQHHSMKRSAIHAQPRPKEQCIGDGMECGQSGMECGQSGVECGQSGMECGQSRMEPDQLSRNGMETETVVRDNAMATTERTVCACAVTRSQSGSHFDELMSGNVPVGLNCSPTDVLCLALHTLMLDSGFLCQQPSSFASQNSSSGVHKWSYGAAVCEEIGITMVCSRMGPSLAVHASTMSDLEEFEPVSCSTQFRISYYTRTKHHPSGAESMLKNTKQLSRVFRDSIAHTLLTEIRKGLGLPEVGTLMSLFPEMKLYILKYLDVRSLVAMAMVCRELYVLAQDGFIWRNLFIRNFGRVSAARKDDSTSWKEVYVEQFKLRKEQQRQHRLFALDMMEPPTRPHVVYPPGFGPLDVPGILGGDYDRLPHPFLPPAHIDLRNRQVVPRPRYDPYGPLPGHPRPDELQPFFEPPLLIDHSNRRRPEFSLGRHHGSFGGFRF